MAKTLMKGNEAIAEAAIRAGCEAYFGYPITPQTEVLEYMSARMPELGRAFVQAESELGAVSMVSGAAMGGVRVMTTTSSPGYSLMQEGISFLAGSKLPCVIVNVVRAGPGLGTIQPAQGDYLQMTKGGGHGDYSCIVLAPSTVQEIVDLVSEAFDLAEKYRQPVLMMADGMIGQIMEPVVLPPMRPVQRPATSWALTGTKDHAKRTITSLHLDPSKMEQHVKDLESIYKRIRESEERYEELMTDDADIIVVAYGTASRIVRTAINIARREGLKVGLFRPIIVAPYPYAALRRSVKNAKRVLVVELSTGQMIEDVKLAVAESVPISFFGRQGGMVPLPEDIAGELRKLKG
jgi:2-oxoglutarate/2-oxoacid ferredoxin oxidoreductase subunit alpha